MGRQAGWGSQVGSDREIDGGRQVESDGGMEALETLRTRWSQPGLREEVGGQVLYI